MSLLAIVIVSGPVMAQTPVEVELACNTWGHDVVLYNRGDSPVAAGTKVHWSVWLGKREGVYRLETDLEPFVGHYLISALGGSYWDLRPCEARVVKDSNAGK